jgi:hypothetical protein
MEIQILPVLPTNWWSLSDFSSSETNQMDNHYKHIVMQNNFIRLYNIKYFHALNKYTKYR